MDGRMPVACGVDAGSTNLKVVLLGDAGVVARAGCPTPLDRAAGTVDPVRLFDLLEDLVLEACGEAYAVQSVCVAGTGEDGVPVSGDLAPLGPALAWHAPTRVALLADLPVDLRATLADAPDLPVATDAARTLVGWHWARRRGLLTGASSWVALTDYAAVRWTGRPFLSDSLAARTAAWRTTDRTWVQDRVEAVLGRPDLLPPVVPGGTVVGELRSARLAAVTVPGAVVVAGGHDHPVGAWAARQVNPGAVLDSMGTAEVVVGASNGPGGRRTDDIDVGPGFPGDPGDTVLRVEELDRNVRWARRDPLVSGAVDAILSGAVAPDPSVDSDAFVPGSRGGGTPSYAATVPDAPQSRASAVLGALARLGTAAVADVASRSDGPSAVLATGGWSRSPGWMRLKQHTGLDATVLTEPEMTAVGAALLGATATDLGLSAGRILGAAV